MSKVRILLADDSVVIRQMLVHILSEEPGFEVIGTAPDGEIALAKIPQVNPDLVILDIEMPKLNGLETLRSIRKDFPHLPVLMFSSFTRMGAETTVDALLLGAQDYVEKPSNTRSREESFEKVRTSLIPRIKEMFPQKFQPPAEKDPRPSSPSPVARDSRPPSGPVEIIVIGVSTGGPTALSLLLANLPKDLKVPILIVQHMPPLFTETLAQRLTTKTPFEVREGKDQETIGPGTVRLAPGDRHMVLAPDAAGTKLKLLQGPLVNSCCPAVDPLFQSAAQIYGNRVLAVILTGMGQDGLKGCEMVWEKGGQVLVQDEKTSVVWGMPGAVAGAGLADGVFSLERMAGEILERIQTSQTSPSLAPAPKGA